MMRMPAPAAQWGGGARPRGKAGGGATPAGDSAGAMPEGLVTGGQYFQAGGFAIPTKMTMPSPPGLPLTGLMSWS
jgi:hypothetical protein